MKNKIIQNIKTISLGLILALGISYASAAGTWTAPTATPPGGNVDAPINTGASSQIKTGTVTLGGLGILGNFTFLPSTGASTAVGQVLVATNTTGGISWGNLPQTALDNVCNTVDMGLSTTGWQNISLLINGKNICSDANGCSYRLWRYTTANPEGVNFYGSNPYIMRQTATGAWIDSGGNNKGINGNATQTNFVDWEGLIFADDATGVENSKDSFSADDNSSSYGYVVTICDL